MPLLGLGPLLLRQQLLRRQKGWRGCKGQHLNGAREAPLEEGWCGPVVSVAVPSEACVVYKACWMHKLFLLIPTERGYPVRYRESFHAMEDIVPGMRGASFRALVGLEANLFQIKRKSTTDPSVGPGNVIL